MPEVWKHIERTLPAGSRPAAIRLSASGVVESANGEDGPGPEASFRERYGQIPYCPTDCFAVTASLLNLSGAYHYIRPPEENADENHTSPLWLSPKDREALTTIGRAWSLLAPFQVLALRRRHLSLARRWLYECAIDDHNIAWFDPTLTDEDRRKITALLDAPQAARRAGKPEPDAFEDYLTIVRGRDEAIVAVEEQSLQSLWDELIDESADARLYSPFTANAVHSWWWPALKLTIAADEASVRMGLAAGEFFDWFRLFSARTAIQLDFDKERRDQLKASKTEARAKALIMPLDIGALTAPSIEMGGRPEDCFVESAAGELNNLRKITFNFAGLNDYDQACIFPKSRKPSVGCTIRNLTNHLALLPGRGIARAYLRSGSEKAFAGHKELNVLIVPYPFRIASNSFAKTDDRSDERRSHGFRVNLTWLQDGWGGHVVEGVTTLLEAAGEAFEAVNAIVLPELALDFATYSELVLRISRNFPHVEFVISGLNGRPRLDPEPGGPRRDNFAPVALAEIGRAKTIERGNFVATTSFMRQGGSEALTYVMTFQPKHHRWKLTRPQITWYNIGHIFDPDFDWWEDIPTKTRSIEFSTFRGGSTVVALACEDLARLEPCQELIRAIGPNLVVALLMDGPQLNNRWSARYATVLADDPGSAVLTLTSLGLLTRTTTPQTVGRRIIGLWKDDSGKTEEIAIPSGCHGAVLRLKGWPTNDITMDGREDGGLVKSWRFAGAVPILDDQLPRELPGEFTGRRPGRHEA